jgi:hypothetical protein
VPVPVVPVPVVPVPVVDVPVELETFCSAPRSSSNPPLRTTPASMVAVEFVPNVSVKVTVIVQSEFTA